MADIFDIQQSSPDASYEDGVLQWVDAKVKEGEALIKDEPAYDDIDRSITFIMGEQIPNDRPDSLANCPNNIVKSLLNQTVAALTDIHPLFGFKTFNPDFKDQENVLVKLAQCWWINGFCDLKLADVIKFAAGVGTGYAEIAWDASMYNGTGDIVIRALDPRNVLPINPTLGGSVQDWQGLITVTAKSPDELKVRFPDKSHRIKADNTPSLISRTWSRAKRAFSSVLSPSAVDALNGSQGRQMPRRTQTTDVFTTYIKDRTLYMGAEPKIMGDPETTWSYTVYPVDYLHVPDGFDEKGQVKYRKARLDESKLYPRGRMIISTRQCVLYDGPNPYWHGMFPVAKLCLDPMPWTLLGHSLTKDLIPLQAAHNETLNGILDHVRKTLRPAVVADKKSVAQGLWERIDTRIPGMKLKTNATAGKGIEFVSPEPLPDYVFEFLQWLENEMNQHAGTPAMSNLMQLQQVPGEDTIEKMQEALSPLLRLKGRMMEYFLRDVGEMVKCNFFQFYNLPRRISMLGDAGATFNDFDFDPGTMIPSMSKDDPGYTPELDKRLERSQRAQWFHKNFTFTITPNSLLAISQISRKLMYLQLRQMQLVDRWTLYDVLEVPNGGAPPNGEETITDRLMAEMALSAQQQTMAMAMGMGAAGAAGGMPPEAGGGVPNGGGNEGRPPSFQQGPQLLNKTDDQGAPRQTISSSGSGGS
jgi:hypothetical protein